MRVPAELRGCQLKMRRAELHLNALRRELARFEAKKPYGIVSEFDSKTSECVFLFNVPRDPSLRWGVIVGDVVHNLRAVLDHLVYALSEIRVSDPKGTGFPIFAVETGKDGYGRKGRPLIRLVPAPCKPFFELYQPYKRTQDPTVHILEVLRVLSNDDKHRVIPAMAIAPFAGTLSYGVERVRDVEREEEMVFRFGVPIKHKTEAARIKIVPNGPQPQMKMEANFPLHIELSHTLPSLDGSSVINLLGGCPVARRT